SQLLKNSLWEFNRDFLRCHWLLDVACFYTFYINTGKLSGIVEMHERAVESRQSAVVPHK
ncbi:MAG: hypothetical protein AAFQ91_32020, partial [Cyanobacteria bacterium J06621_15]